MGMFLHKRTKRFGEEKRVLKNGRSSSGKQDWSKFNSGKIDFLNASYTEEIDYWKKAALGSKNEEERKQLGNPAPLKIFWLVNVLERVELKIFMKCLFI